MELYDADLLSFGVQLAHGLDRAFGLPPKVAASQRDVPGLTRAAIPILSAQGVKAITGGRLGLRMHGSLRLGQSVLQVAAPPEPPSPALACLPPAVGVNGASAPPAVPANRPFVWRDEASGTSLLAMWHPGGYSGSPVDSRDQCVQAEGLPHALCFAWRGDNVGPPGVQEVRRGGGGSCVLGAWVLGRSCRGSPQAASRSCPPAVPKQRRLLLRLPSLLPLLFTS